MDWKEKLMRNLQDEVADVIKYAEYARHTHGEIRQMFHDMAEEEWEHAWAVWHIMEHEHMTDGLDKHKIFADAKAALYK